LTALNHRRLPKLGGITVALLLVGAQPVDGASDTPLSATITAIINWLGVTIAGVIATRVTTARMPVAQPRQSPRDR
jgi:hypothetical protein